MRAVPCCTLRIGVYPLLTIRRFNIYRTHALHTFGIRFPLCFNQHRYALSCFREYYCYYSVVVVGTEYLLSARGLTDDNGTDGKAKEAYAGRRGQINALVQRTADGKADLCY